MPRNTNAGMVARKVIEQMKKGERPNIKEAMLQVGYRASTAAHKQAEVKANPAYKKEIKPFLERLDGLIDDAMDIMEAKKNKASYRDATVGLKTMKDLKNIETGNPTDYSKIVVEWEE